MTKHTHRIIVSLSASSLLLCAASIPANAQAPGVEIVRDRGEQFKTLVKKANVFREEGSLLSLKDAEKQLERKTCKIELPEPNTKPLSDREIWQTSRAAHLRVGWHYLCNKCDNWHQSLAGGYFINTNGAAATCFHVITAKEKGYREGYLVAASEDGDLYPVTEILAADELSDTAIIQVKIDGPVTVLPLNENTHPGDAAWCYSDPLGRSGYFSKGIINRFFYHRNKSAETKRIEVSTDWAPGSSGSAVLDQFGNAIGHVSEITAAGTGKGQLKNAKTGDDEKIKVMSDPTVIVFRSASRAADVLALIEKEE